MCEENPLFDQPLSMEDYAAGKPETRAIMDKIFSFPFTQDFKKAYNKEGFYSVCFDKENKPFFQNKEFVCNVLNYEGGTYFSILFFNQQSNFFALETDNLKVDSTADSTTSIKYLHILEIGHQIKRPNVVAGDRITQEWVLHVKQYAEDGFSLSIKDDNPNNNSFLNDVEGKRLLGPCSLQNLLATAHSIPKAQLVESDSFTLIAKKGKESYSLKYSYIPFGELGLGSK